MSHTVPARPTSGQTFDAVLGPRSSRYFGAGYRRTRYHLPPLRPEEDDGGLLAGVAGVSYPADWSHKPGVSRVPHLSTADAIVLGAHAAEMALTRALGLNRDELRDAWFAEFAVRTGAHPVSALDEVPVSCRWAVDPDDRRRSDYLIKVGTFTVTAVVCHPEVGIPARRRVGTIGPTLYTHGFRETDHVGRILDADATAASLKCYTEVGPQVVHDGIESGTGTAASLVDCLVFAGQMLQMLVSLIDGVTRDRSGNLWLRTITFSTSDPARPAWAQPRMRITDRQDVVRGDDVLHALSVRCEGMFGTTMAGKAAYADTPG
ncbi:AvrD family protein [Isoptericola aurantiacus]|uniref:AvrD family protein n=1 Tax=Isoptericola aurantiacus TaxID=3377839 RepID=UPI00383A654C